MMSQQKLQKLVLKHLLHDHENSELKIQDVLYLSFLFQSKLLQKWSESRGNQSSEQLNLIVQAGSLTTNKAIQPSK